MLRYQYNPASPNPVGPVRKYRNGVTAMDYAWKDFLRLAACVDHETGLTYRFRYDARGMLDQVRITGANGAGKTGGMPGRPGTARGKGKRGGGGRHPLAALANGRERELALTCVSDQVGTPKLYRGPDGVAFKHMACDSFGNRHKDSLPALFMPVGFAGGLEDKDTGLVRFGYRDYDPYTGRFTCPDPLGDTGGDHDLYDYCVDDPVSLVDPLGLNPHAAWQGLTFLAQQATRYAPRVIAAARGGLQAVANGAHAITSGIANGSARAGQAIIEKGKEVARNVTDKVGPIADKIVDAAREAEIATSSMTPASSISGKVVQATTVGGQFAVGAMTPHDGNAPSSLPQGIGVAVGQLASKQDTVKSTLKNVEKSVKEGAEKARKIKRQDML